MSVFDNFADSPDQIKLEGQEITIKFQRTSDTTARISWNIPPPAHGCSADRQAYDGIVITVGSTPATYISTSPKDGTYYEGDLTADTDIHAGSVLDTALVLAALYHDKTTTFIDIEGIKPKTPYYVSGYAVDAVGRYHREGVHAYSLPTGIQSYTTIDYPASHDVQIYSVNPMTTRTLTGLSQTLSYVLPLKIECRQYDFTVNGIDALTYGDLVNALNEQFSLMGTPYKSPNPPNTGEYYFDTETSLLYIFDGYKLTLVSSVLISTIDPATPVNGTFWLNTTTGVLSMYTAGSWVVISQIVESDDTPTELACDDVWYDGTTVRAWEGGHWCDYVTIESATNPQLPANLTCNDFWYHTTDKEIFRWSEKLQKWQDALVIYSDVDPNTLNTGAFWYDETAAKMKRFVGSNWNTLTHISYVDSDANGDYPSDLATVGGNYWYDTLTLKFYQRNLLNTEWEELEYVSFPVNPRNRKSCDLWWNSSPSVDDLYVWEAVTSTWVPVGTFFRQDTDPTDPPLLDDNTAWVTPDGDIYLIDNTNCAKVNYITSTINPREFTDGMIWKDGDGNYFVYDTGEWVQITVLKYATDPFVPFNGMLWLNPTDFTLNKYNAGAWFEQCLHTNREFLPAVGDQWYNTVDDLLMEWIGTTWLPGKPFVKVEFVPRTCLTDYDTLRFATKKTGCHQAFEVMSTSANTLFAGLTNSVIYMDPIEGADGVDAGPMFKQLGVGDDGSPDERRKLHENIRITLGAPAIRVELTKQQLDKCIDNALLMLRKHSSYAYKKAMFFMDLKPHQQIYNMTNRCVGFNKIVDITAIHRMKAGAFRTAYAGNDNFAYAALQQLYTLGTFDMLTFHLTSAYIEELETLFASRIMYQWLERQRQLKLYQVPRGGEKVLIEGVIERTEQELLTDRETTFWLEQWAIAEAKGMLAQTRGKFITLPGPNGTTQLNYNDLQTQVDTEKTRLIEEIQSKAMQDLVDVGMRAHFIMG